MQGHDRTPTFRSCTMSDAGATNGTGIVVRLA